MQSGCLPVGNQLVTDGQSIGDWLASVSWTYVYDRRNVFDCLETSRQPIGDQFMLHNLFKLVLSKSIYIEIPIKTLSILFTYFGACEFSKWQSLNTNVASPHILDYYWNGLVTL